MGSRPGPGAHLRSSIPPTTSQTCAGIGPFLRIYESMMSTRNKQLREDIQTEPCVPRAAAGGQLSWWLYDGARPVKLKRLLSSSSHSPAQLVPGDNCRCILSQLRWEHNIRTCLWKKKSKTGWSHSTATMTTERGFYGTAISSASRR